VEWQWLAESPLRRVRRLREPRGRVRYLTDDERERLLQACQASSTPALYPLVVLALATGARKMELLRLTWQDIDMRRAQVSLAHSALRAGF
jgi:integrase